MHQCMLVTSEALPALEAEDAVDALSMHAKHLTHRLKDLHVDVIGCAQVDVAKVWMLSLPTCILTASPGMVARGISNRTQL